MALKRSFFLKNVTIALGLLVVGCHHTPRDFYAESLQSRKSLIAEYGEVTSEEIDAYFRSLTARLELGAARSERFRDSKKFSVTVLKTTLPIAYSSGSGIISVSRGLIRSLKTEGELAFVIAHEMAHELAGHTKDYLGEKNGVDASLSESIELEADNLGVGILALSGYDPRVAVPGLVNSYKALKRTERALPSRSANERYPDLNRRLYALQSEIAASGWRPPGTVDRRDFQKLRSALSF